MSAPNATMLAARPHRHWSANPGLLLLASGVLIGLGFPLAKLAEQARIPISAWITLHSFGATLAMLPLLLAKRQIKLPRGRQWRYAAIAGPLTFAGPNLLVYMVVPQVGAGFSGTVFALSPVYTAVLARLFGAGNLGRLRIIGIGLGLAGTLSIGFSRGGYIEPASVLWVGVAMTIPLLLAAGNIYRSLDWPRDSAPEFLAFWSHAFVLLLYFCATMLFARDALWQMLESEPILVLAQLLSGGLIAPTVFRLQRFGGPVMLSQGGYVSAATSLFVAMIFLGETYELFTWLSVVVIGVGIGVTVSAGKRER